MLINCLVNLSSSSLFFSHGGKLEMSLGGGNTTFSRKEILFGTRVILSYMWPCKWFEPKRISSYSVIVRVRVQCSSDISELRIRVSYERILRIRVCQYAHIYEYIRAHIRVYTRVYVSLLCIPVSFFMWSIVSQTENIIFLGSENGFKGKFAYF